VSVLSPLSLFSRGGSHTLQYEKLVLDKDGNIKKEEFVVEGRKQ